PRGRAELVGEFALPLPITVIGELLGVPEADRDRFRTWTDDMLDRPFDARTDLAVVVAAREQMHGYLSELVAAKRRDTADDLLTDLIAATDEGERLDEQELLAMTFLLLVAGYVTTVSLIGNGTLALLHTPDQLDRLRADPSLVPRPLPRPGRAGCGTRRFRPPGLRARDPLLPGRAPGPDRGAGGLHRTGGAAARPRPGHARGRAPVDRRRSAARAARAPGHLHPHAGADRLSPTAPRLSGGCPPSPASGRGCSGRRPGRRGFRWAGAAAAAARGRPSAG